MASSSSDMTPLLSFSNVSFAYDVSGYGGAGYGATDYGATDYGATGHGGDSDRGAVDYGAADYDVADAQNSFALHNISLTINSGEFVCVLGHNGSGKSTFARLMNALLVPTQGEVRIKGMSTFSAQHVFDIRQTVGMVFQNPDNQIIASLVEQEVAFGPENLGVKNPELRARVTQSLAQVGLSGYEMRETNALSGGEKQRLALAGVLAMRPQVLVLDEATSMLDPSGQRAFLEICEALHRQGTTIIMITHSPEEAVRAQRALVFYQGRCVMDDSCQNVFSHADLLTRYGIGEPFALALSHELQKRSIPVASHVRVGALREELCALRGQSVVDSLQRQV